MFFLRRGEPVKQVHFWGYFLEDVDTTPTAGWEAFGASLGAPTFDESRGIRLNGCAHFCTFLGVSSLETFQQRFFASTSPTVDEICFSRFALGTVFHGDLPVLIYSPTRPAPSEV